MNAQQLMNQDDKRAEAVNQLSELCTRLGLSYQYGETLMMIDLPVSDDVEMPIVATIEVPLEEEKHD